MVDVCYLSRSGGIKGLQRGGNWRDVSCETVGRGRGLLKTAFGFWMPSAGMEKVD
jgi:hypothetical protein